MAQIYAVKSKEITSQEIAHMELVRKLAGECVVLLENDGTLPLAHPETIALFGTGARQTVKGGTGSGDVNSRTVVSIEQGLTEAGFTISTKDWLDRYDAHWKQTKEEHNAWIKAEAEKKGLPPIAVAFDHPLKSIPPVPITAEDIAMSHTDTALYVLSRNSGEGADRFCKAGDYLLSPEEEENLRQISAHFGNVVVVLNTGGIIDIAAVKRIPGISAIVQMAQLGNTGGHVLADVLLGKVNPSGKLTDTWAKDYYDYPSSRTFSHNNGDVHDDYYTDGIYMGYRYFDTFGVEPVYPFGYGLSYTDFSIETKKVAVHDSQVWQQAPFNGDYTSSVFVSQDPVAIDSVGADFLMNEPAVTSRNGALRDNATVENYLHEAGLVSAAPSGTVYTDSQGHVVNNLGVHEHWNNSTQRQYSRNLGESEGIELISITK